MTGIIGIASDIRALISWIANLAELIDENQAAVRAVVAARNCHLVHVDGESRQPNAYLWCSNIQCSDMQIRIIINVLASYRNKQPLWHGWHTCMFYTRVLVVEKVHGAGIALCTGTKRVENG